MARHFLRHRDREAAIAVQQHAERAGRYGGYSAFLRGARAYEVGQIEDHRSGEEDFAAAKELDHNLGFFQAANQSDPAM